MLACWLQQEGVSPLDVSRWATDCQLPYLSFSAEEGAGLMQYRSVLTIDLIAVKGGSFSLASELLHATAVGSTPAVAPCHL